MTSIEGEVVIWIPKGETTLTASWVLRTTATPHVADIIVYHKIHDQQYLIVIYIISKGMLFYWPKKAAASYLRSFG